MPFLKQPIVEAFDLSEEEADSLDMPAVFIYCDILNAEHFYGLPQRYNFSDE
jgi:hypothetical protein